MINIFQEQLRSELNSIAADYETNSNLESFTVWVGWRVFDLLPEQISQNLILYLDNQFGSILAFLDEDTDQVNIIVCWYEDLPSTQLSEGQLLVLESLWDVSQEANENITPAFSDFVFSLQEKGIVDYKYYIVANALFPTESHIDSKFMILDVNTLQDQYLLTQDPLRVTEPEKLQFILPRRHAFIGPNISVDNEEPIPTLVCALPLHLVHEWVSQYHNGLFAENLRLRLSQYDRQAKDLETDVVNTVMERPEHIFVKNNGITITCSEIEPSPHLLTNIFEDQSIELVLKKPQVVNGCQTSWAIYAALERIYKTESKSPSGYVLSKIIQTKNRDLARSITSASNRQNAILSRDQKVKDPRQISISKELAERVPNLGIYWDYRRGGWTNILHRKEEELYQVQGKSRVYRKIKSEEAGQVMIALAGEVHEAINKKGKIFDIDKLYNLAFAYDLSTNQRFSYLQEESFLRTGSANALQEYVEDLLFGIAVYRHAEAAFKELYSVREQKLRRELLTSDSIQMRQNITDAIGKISEREFVKYWNLHVVRLVHVVVEQWVTRFGANREELRRNLVGDMRQSFYTDILFVTQKQRASWFNAETDIQKPHTLDSKQPSLYLPLLGSWFSVLEDFGLRVYRTIREKEPNLTARYFALSRSVTHRELAKVIIDMDDPMLANVFPRSKGAS